MINNEEGQNIIEDFKKYISIEILSKKYHHHHRDITIYLKEKIGEKEYHDIIYLHRSASAKTATTGKNNPFYGKQHSEETKKKISKANEGKKRTDEFKNLCSERMRGKKNPAYGKHWKLSDEQLSHRRILKGEFSSNWKGGHTPEYYLHSASKEWRIARKKCIVRDNKICQLCGKRGEEVHHIIPWRISKNDSLSNLVLLCISCHRNIEVLTSNFIEQHGTNPLMELQIADGNVFRKTLQRVGFDIYMVNDETISPHKFKKLETNLRFPQGLGDLFAILTLRSSYQDSGLILPSGIGIIDGDYTDKIFVTVYNITDEKIEIKKKERIAQLVFLENISRHIILVKNNDIELIGK